MHFSSFYLCIRRQSKTIFPLRVDEFRSKQLLFLWVCIELRQKKSVRDEKFVQRGMEKQQKSSRHRLSFCTLWRSDGFSCRSLYANYIFFSCDFKSHRHIWTIHFHAYFGCLSLSFSPRRSLRLRSQLFIHLSKINSRQITRKGYANFFYSIFRSKKSVDYVFFSGRRLEIERFDSVSTFLNRKTTFEWRKPEST